MWKTYTPSKMMMKLMVMTATVLVFLMMVYVFLYVSTSTYKEGIQSETCNNCFTYPYRYVLNEEYLCPPFGPQVLILINSNASSFARRDLLRNTLGRSARAYPGFVSMAFVVGSGSGSDEGVMRESSMYHDVIQGNVKDTVEDRTLKTVLMLKWVSDYCARASYFLKVDDDIYLNLPALLDKIHSWRETRTINAVENAIMGNCKHSEKPIRGSTQQHAVSYIQYQYSLYPPFCRSALYFMSGHLAKKLYETSAHVPFFILEDVYLGLILHHLGYSVRSDKWFTPMNINQIYDLTYVPSMCFCYCSLFFHSSDPKVFMYVYGEQVRLDCASFYNRYNVDHHICFLMFVHPVSVGLMCLLTIVCFIVFVFYYCYKKMEHKKDG